jgi:hypothetical protein
MQQMSLYGAFCAHTGAFLGLGHGEKTMKKLNKKQQQQT